MAQRGKRRVNYYVKHIIVDVDGNFSKERHAPKDLADLAVVWPRFSGLEVDRESRECQAPRCT